MSLSRIKETFIRLPKQIKFIGVGGLLLAISTLLPWYADLDSYKIGDEFLGVTGPASFVGIVILLLSGFSLWLFSTHLLGKKSPRLPVKEAIIHLFVAVESVFLLILVNSIYFHPKFGVNITLKESRFGMTLAFVAAAVLFIGAFLQNREASKHDNEIGKLEPLIKMEDASRTHSAVRPQAKEEPKKMFPYAKEGTRGFLFGEAKVAGQNATTEKPVEEENGNNKQSGGSGSYMYRDR